MNWMAGFGLGGFWASVGILAGVHLAYPFLMWVVARRHGHGGSAERRAEWLPHVTLIIPSHNEEVVIEAKVENSLAIDYPREKLEIIVASDGSSDRTVEIAQGFEGRGIKVLAFRERRGKAATLNDAVQAAQGEVVCLCDANVMFQPDALRRMAARLEEPDVGAVSGDVRLASEQSDFGQGERVYYRIERPLQEGESRVGSMMGVDGGMYLIRRELFRPLPPDTILDDFKTSMNVIRQGKRVVYEPSAVAHENGTPSARQEFRRRVRVAAGAVQSILRGDWPPWWRPVEVWQYVSHRLLRWLGPVWLVALLVSSAMLWNAGVVYRAALGAQAVVYLLAVAATVSLRFRATRVGGVIFYAVMSHVAMAVGEVKGLLNLQRAAWERTERTPAAQKELARTAG